MKMACGWILTLCLFGSVVVGCQSEAPPRTAATAVQSQPVNHVVICWLKERGNPEARQKLIDATETFRKIPGVVDVRCGLMVPSTRPTVDSSYDVGIVMTFDSPESLRSYNSHPIHVQAVKDTLVPLVQKFIVYDFAR